jgi:hypothetical protein
MTVTYRLATSKVNFSFSASNFRVAFNPECFLPQFLPDPPVARAFRTVQAETGVIIFGKATCQFSCTHAIHRDGDDRRGWVVRLSSERFLDKRRVRCGDARGRVCFLQGSRRERMAKSYTKLCSRLAYSIRRQCSKCLGQCVGEKATMREVTDL